MSAMATRLGPNQYGKAETHLVRVYRDGDSHSLRDLTVSVALAGDLEAVHRTGDNAHVLPTDTQKNTVYAFASEAPIGAPEAFALRLARHFVAGPIRRARVEIGEVPWARIAVDGRPHPHAFMQAGAEQRTAAAICTGDGEWVLSGLADLVLLKSTGSEFSGYARDRYTTLPETRDRVLATAVRAKWRHAGTDAHWDASYAQARHALIEAFAATHSLSLQQTLYAMAEAVLAVRPELAEVRMSMPNRHHFVVDLAPFGLENPNEVFHADDRPYGLIEGAVAREGAPPPGPAWDPYPLI
jgi:urate oxidase